MFSSLQFYVDLVTITIVKIPFYHEDPLCKRVYLLIGKFNLVTFTFFSSAILEILESSVIDFLLPLDLHLIR